MSFWRRKIKIILIRRKLKVNILMRIKVMKSRISKLWSSKEKWRRNKKSQELK